MEGNVERFVIGGVSCAAFVPAGEGPWPVVYLCGGDMENLLPQIALDVPNALLVSITGDWERDYTPWPAPALPNRAAFAGGAAEHLALLTRSVIPGVEGRYPVRGGRALIGYSLGGLFALWALHQTDAFRAFGSLSGSLWYDGWLDFAFAHPPAPGARVYLSLGRSEERAGNPRMASVGENTRRSAARLAQSLGEENVLLEWNRGGHFAGIPNRWRKALSWTLPRL